jgi:hypothetical protein
VTEFLHREFWWAIHNLIAHPVMQVCRFISLFGTIRSVDSFGEWLHDWTTPGDRR